MSVFKLSDVKTLEVPGRDISFIATPKTSEIKNMAAGVTKIHEGSQLPVHAHDKEEEMMHFIKGKGEAVLDGETIPVMPGDTFCVPAGGVHTVRNTGEGPLSFFFVFSPPLDTKPYEIQVRQDKESK